MSGHYLIIGAGFAGAVCAERLAACGNRVLIADKRPHIAGNAYDEYDSNGILIHPYGPHIFHTNSKRIFEYLSQFTHWRFYEHRVLARVNGAELPIPINRTTINKLYDLDLSEADAKAYIENVRVKLDRVATSEDVVLSSVGHDLCEKFFRGYTLKQWGLDLSQLSAGVAARIPTRSNDDDRYFGDTMQFMPADGYTSMFKKMLANPNIEVRLDTDGLELKRKGDFSHVIYTGPLDAYFDYRLGRLPYRSLRFEHEHLPTTERLQKVGTVNYPNDEQFTRITEFKHLTGQSHPGTSIVREYPQADGDPFYPIPRPENEAKFQEYKAMADTEQGVTFVGRLAQYRYYNMDQVVGAALVVADELTGEK
ncbi:UDP-galactopyranose mutase [Bradyrhizobium cosmicum]|uniref:UDP-galactopyranose mutase n=1 Tax=Bradyrhizobium cosmicum TaxID=1404864 RepID=UPI001163A085|nr:UDP-galactopyranose mutase [Bradyrhizobium cosmicum]QDP24378.1 UDP-galactopyranose mutase [Bradyrhizobium cosmicum]